MSHRLSKGRRIVTEISRALRGCSVWDDAKVAGRRHVARGRATHEMLTWYKWVSREKKKAGKAEACWVKGSLAVQGQKIGGS